MSWVRIGDRVKMGRNVKLGSWTAIEHDAVIGDNVVFGDWSRVLAGETVPDSYVFGPHEIFPSPPKDINVIHGGGPLGIMASWFLDKEFRDMVLGRDRT